MKTKNIKASKISFSQRPTHGQFYQASQRRFFSLQGREFRLMPSGFHENRPGLSQRVLNSRGLRNLRLSYGIIIAFFSVSC